MDEKFNSLEELYNRLLPAINTKLEELKRIRLSSISSLDIWQYCMKNKWKDSKDLRIYEMVDDILNIDELNLEIYIKKNNIDRR